MLFLIFHSRIQLYKNTYTHFLVHRCEYFSRVDAYKRNSRLQEGLRILRHTGLSALPYSSVTITEKGKDLKSTSWKADAPASLVSWSAQITVWKFSTKF